MKRPFLYITTIILTIFLCISFKARLGVKSFNYNEVKAAAEHLSSKEFKGRLTGTPENRAAAEYIKDWFVQNNIKPYYDDYYESFEVLYPQKLDKSPYLRIKDSSGNIIHEYKYGTDYKEDMINFKKNYVLFDGLSSRIINDEIIQIKDGTDSFIFYSSDEKEMQFRSSFFSDSQINMCVFTSKGTFNEIKDYLSKDMSVECFLPYETAKTTVQNVIGVIRGKNQICLRSYYLLTLTI
jgi:hypothetical protein